MKETGKRIRRQLALLVVTALLAGMLPVGTPTVGKAATSDPAEKTGREGYGLNNPRTNADGVMTWDCVWFGNYWQEDTNKDGIADQNDAKTPIKWRVLSVDGDDAFLLADKNLDCRKYNETYSDVTWETCTMRDWLNGDFLDTAFSESEQSAIRTTNVVNDNNPEFDTEGGNNTLDKVYLLSLGEVMDPDYGFSSDFGRQDEARRAKNTEYAKAQGEYADWWLRSPGDNCDDASCVSYSGNVDREGYIVNCIILAVRPALHLNLKASPDGVSPVSWSYAGTVTSDGKVEEPESTPTPEPSASADPTEKPDVTPTVTPVETTNPGTDPTATPDVGQTPAPTATAGVTPTNQPGVPPTADPHATATPAATTDPGIGPTATPDAGQTPAPTATADITPTNQPDVPATADPQATATPAATTDPGTDPTATPDAGQTPAPTATAGVTPTNQPDVPPTADPHATATPAATTDPGSDPTATPDAGQTPAPTATAGVTPTNQPDVPPTADPQATPTATPGAAVPQPQPPFPQPVAPVLQPPVVSSALTGIGTIPSVKLKQKKQAVTVSWKKVSGADGYQVCYSTSKKWKKKKQKLTRSNKLTVKKLKKKKTYYFRVQAYRKNGTGKIYGAWSKTKKIKIKKKK